MIPFKRITIVGDFTDAEFVEITALLREMDTRRPEACFNIISEDWNRPLGSAKDLIAKALPPVPGRYTDWTACEWSVGDDSTKSRWGR